MSDPLLLTGIPLLLFLVVGATAVASAILVVAMRNPVHSALFLLVTFLCVAVLFIMQGAEFVGAVQVLVYAGGIMVLFLFVVMLINVKQLPREKVFSPLGGIAVILGILLFAIFSMILSTGTYAPAVNAPDHVRTTTVERIENVKTVDGTIVATKVTERQVVGNSEAVGMALYRDYLVPFEVASIFLLVAMIGAIVIGKRDLGASEEEEIPQYLAKRVAEEHRVKEVTGA